MNLPELTRDERAALAFLLRKGAKFGAENIWPKVHSIGVAIGKKPRTVARIMTNLTAFGIIERVGRGRAANIYKILLNSEQLIGIIGKSYQKDIVAFGKSKENLSKVTQITLVKPRIRHANGESTPSLCPPTPPKEKAVAPIDKLYRMTERWIAENEADLGVCPEQAFGQIMRLLEKSGASKLPENGPLPAITWPPEANPLLKLAESLERKPVQSLTAEQYEFLRRKIGGTE